MDGSSLGGDCWVDVRKEVAAVLGEGIKKSGGGREARLRSFDEGDRNPIPGPGVGGIDQRAGLVRVVRRAAVIKPEIPQDAGTDGDDRELSRRLFVERPPA